MMRTRSWHHELGVVGVALAMVGSAEASGQDPPAARPPIAAQEERSTGLPSKVQWTFNFDAGLGTFGFGNSLYTDVRPDPSGNLSDNWAESYAKPALTADLGLGTSRLYGKVSVIGERTIMAPPSLVGEGASSFQAEDLYLGWRSGMTLRDSEDLLDVTVGRAPYTIGHGLLVWDGAGDGGSRGGLWSNVRTAWAFAAIARLKPKNHAIELFYLERDDLPESRTGTRFWGLNYDLAASDVSTFGASYLRFHADPSELPERNGMTAFNVRAYTAPARALPDLSFEFEYTREQNADLLRSNAWTLQAGYRLSQVAGTPRLSYRYAFFEGDDPRQRSTNPSTCSYRDSTTGARGGRARLRESTSSPTRISSRIRCGCTRRRPRPSAPA